MGHETLLYTAFPTGRGTFEIPFLICIGPSFAFTMVVMVAMSLAGPAINARAIQLQLGLFRMSRQTLTLIVVTLLLITALYAKFW